MVKSRRREIRFEPEQVERGERMAQEMGLTFSDIVRLALNDYLKQRGH